MTDSARAGGIRRITFASTSFTMLLLHRLCKRLALLFPEGGVSIFRQASIGTALVRVRFHRQWHISVISANALLPASPTPIVQTSSPVFLEKIWMIDRPAVSGQPFLRHIDQCQKVDIGFAILFSAGIGAIEQQLLQLISENTLQSGMNFVQDGRKLCGSYHVRSPLLRLNTRTLSMEAGTKPKSRSHLHPWWVKKCPRFCGFRGFYAAKAALQ